MFSIWGWVLRIFKVTLPLSTGETLKNFWLINVRPCYNKRKLLSKFDRIKLTQFMIHGIFAFIFPQMQRQCVAAFNITNLIYKGHQVEDKLPAVLIKKFTFYFHKEKELTSIICIVKN